MKFKVGDIVYGNPKSDLYFVSDTRVLKAIVINVCGDKSIDISILQYLGDSREIGNIYTGLDPDCFDLCKDEIKIKYHVSDMTKLENVEGDKSDWIDLRTAENVFIPFMEYMLISLGVSMQLPVGKEAHMVARSSAFKNFGIIQTNGKAIIDESYCGDNDIWRFPALCLAKKHTKFIYIDDEGETKETIVPYEESMQFMIDNREKIQSFTHGTFIPKDSRICQFRLFDHQTPVRFSETDSLGNPDRGGIGSTGTK